MSQHPSSQSNGNQDAPIQHQSQQSSLSGSAPALTPPNQPRRSLSTQLAPDYHNWVNDVSTSSSNSSAAPPPASNRFLDAVTGRSNAQRGRARRENQPSLTGSAFTLSDNEAERMEEDDDNEGGIGNGDYEGQTQNQGRSQAPTDRVGRSLDPSLVGGSSRSIEAVQDDDKDNKDNKDNRRNEEAAAGSSSSTRLPSLDKSRVQVPDPSRPAFKLGTPISSKPRTPKSPTSPTLNKGANDTDRVDPPTERSSLLGNYDRSRNGQESESSRWTNEGSRRRTPWYSGPNQPSDLEDIDDNTSVGDSLRRPSRARSLSPTMELRREDQGNRGRGRVMFNGGAGQNGRRRNNNKTFHNLRRSSMAIRDKLLSRRRSTVYDDVKEALVKENNGIRVWYHNYTTIDWIHDFVKERVRLRHLRSIGGVRGLIKNRADSMKGWILVLLTGVITACLAAFIDVSSWWLGDLRMGYCTTNFWWSQYFCCWGSTGSGTCPEWISWSSALSSDSLGWGMSNDTFDWIIYCSFGTLFAGICVVMVTSDGTVSQQMSHGATKRRTSKASIETTLVAAQPKKIAYFGAGSGIPEVKTILGGFVIRGFLGFRTLMIKLIGLPLMVASGLNMGKQGPLVHIACCVGNIVCRFFDKYNRNDGKRREILSAASASGVAVAFGAPIGGVLFSLEEVSYYFPSKTMWRTYFCALTSAVVLKMINPYRVGKTVLFQVTYDRDWHLFEAIPFFFISVFGGIYGAIFSQFHMSYSRFRSRTWIGRHPVQEVLIVTLITCAVQWLNPWTRVNLLQLLTNLYSECTPENNLNGMCAGDINQIYPIFLLLAEVFAMKVLLNFITFGVKVPGGIFIPTMVAGAVFGRMVGLGMQWLIATYPEHHLFQVCENDQMDCIIPGLYALVGAAACLSGVTRMTVSLVVIMFELTGAMTYALPIMMAVMISKFVGDAFSPDAFFNKLIELNEHPYLDNKKDYNTFGTAADIADRYLETIDVNDLNDVESLRRKVEILAALGYSDGGLPIVDRGILVGYIASNELEHALGLAEKKHPECICLFRNRASSNVPATEIITSLNDLESQANATTNHQEPPKFEERRRREWPREDSRDDLTYDNDMQGYDKPVRDAPGRPGDSRGYDTNKSNGAHSGRSGYDGFAGDDEASLLYSNRPRMLVRSDSRVSSTTTGDIVYDPARTMDCTPFTDQAPLAVSLFSSMDLVMELFIKLGIKYVCVVKAGEHYGMIHKKRLLAFLKENDQKQKRNHRGSCF